MSFCSDCNNTGFKLLRNLTWPEHTGTLCHCPIGAERRKQSNLETILASRLHTDQHDERSESIAGNPFPDDDLTPNTMADRLRSAGYRAPTIHPIPHTCYSCGVNAVSTCATQCKQCSEEMTELRKAEESADNRVLYAALVGAVSAAIITVFTLKLFGVIP
jgi:hypothetical protein